MILGRYRQRPTDVRRRMVDYSAFLESGETVASVVGTVAPVTDTPFAVSGLIIDPDGDRFAYVTSGGESGKTYALSLRVTTSAGQVKNDTIEFDIEDDE